MKKQTLLPDNINPRSISPEDRKAMGILLPEEVIAKCVVKEEKDLQEKVEDWLHLNGWWRRVPDDIRNEKPPMGWQLHFFKTQKNPIVLDVILLANTKRWTEFELKMPGGKYSSEEQRILCECHNKPVFYEFEACIGYILMWIQGGC